MKKNMTNDNNKPVTTGEFRAANKEFRQTMKTFVTKKELQLAIKGSTMKLEMRMDAMEEKMVTKVDHNNLMTLVDELMTEVRASRQERLFWGKQKMRIDDLLVDHEKRIGTLEKAA